MTYKSHTPHKANKANRPNLLVKIACFVLLFCPIQLSAQITIGGNVYGGGNAGEVGGNTTVTIRDGQIHNVFGGGRMADVGGRAFVNLDGEHSEASILIASVYGGNDISGTVGTNVLPNESGRDQVPTALTEVLRGNETLADHPEKNDINNSWSAFIRSSKIPNEGQGYEDDVHCILVGSVYGGGNGDYDYRSTADTQTGQTTHYIYERGSNTPIATKVTDTGDKGFTSPTLAKTYLEINGGHLSQVYGGGNNATVTDNTVISMNNTSVGMADLFAPWDPNGSQTYEQYVAALMQQVTFLAEFTGISTFQSDLASINYNSARVFGGNNKVAMAIQPKWNLRNGLIRDLYSGGNQGDMTYERGLILDIPATSNILVENVYGGCRRADVHPNVNDAALEEIQLPAELGYKFPKGYSARVLVAGGDVRNVYGGNDISGNVYGGSAVGIYTSIRGDVYGAGNGSYGYTDNYNLKDTPGYGDFYYDVNGILNTGHAEGTSFTSMQSAQALFMHRPNAERVSLRVWGPDADHPTIIGGSIYVGGNSATLQNTRSNTTATGELKIGSNVIANNVFLGNNGEQMVQTSILGMYKEGYTVTVNGTAYDYSQMDLTTKEDFAEYMKGCASFIRPAVVFDKHNDDGTGDPDTYQPFTSYFGSFFCGGNIGSMMWPGTAELNFNREIIIFDKLVAGCNNAHVPILYPDGHDGDVDYALNAEYKGGVLGSEAEQAPGGMLEDPNDPDSKIKNAIVLNLNSIRIEPKRWVVKRDANYNRLDADDHIITVNDKPVYLANCTNNCQITNINDICSHGKHAYLEWNTIDRTGPEVAPQTTAATIPANGLSTQADLDRRLTGGNVYGGCYNSGDVNGSVTINIDATIMHQDELFDRVAQDELGEAILYGTDLQDVLTQDRQNLNILERRTGVCLARQGMDVLGKALNIFGGGYGKDTEIWGSTTINHNAGYVFQIFGGSERGVIGKPYDGSGPYVDFNGSTYRYNPKYSCTVNLRGNMPGVSKQDSNDEAMARAEFVYGGGFMGPICGNTIIHLGNGRVFNTFAGSCMADILGHTETYIGVQVDKQSVETGEGFPYVRDYIYCGNDLGGTIMGEADFIGRVRTDDFDGDLTTTPNDNTKAIIQATPVHTANVTKASAYVEYRQGRSEGIFGGCYGTYDYTDPYFGDYFYATGATDIDATHPAGTARAGYTKPRMGNAFVNFRPTDTDALLIGANKYNFVNRIYGAGQGYPGDADRDILQRSSYVLIDIPQRMTNYLNMEVFGAGAWSGLGMHKYFLNKTATQIAALTAAEKTEYDEKLDSVSAAIDLVRGQVGAAYGGSYSEGITRRTMVNVPDGSTIRIGSIFGGAYGTETFMPCDVYESNVEFHSANATLIYNPERTDDYGNTIGHPLHNGALYGGNNDKRRTLYTHINIDKRVNMSHYQYGMSRGYVFGAGKGGSTWAEYTEVNLNDGAEVYEVYGGGQAGKVFCAEAVTAYKNMPRSTYLPVDPNDNTIVVWPAGTYKEGQQFTDADFNNAWKLGGGYDPAPGKAYWETTATNLANPLARRGEIDDRNWEDITPEDLALVDHKYTTNVIIREGAYVANYAYAGGLGEEAMVGGHTYIALLGGEVDKDIYAGGTSGPVEDAFGGGNYSSTNQAGFEATTTAYIEGGTVRNVYGGGWRGAVGYHKGSINTATTNDVLGQSHVVVGKVNGTSHIDGIPSITRNVYGGGEGGAIFGTAHVKINNGYIGFRYKNTAAANAPPVYEYVPELDDAAPDDGLLDKGGNVFGGGYVANSYVDYTDLKMYGGTVRGCLFGGGEIGPVGRGTTHPDTLALGRTANIPKSATDNTAIAAIYKAGRTDVRMYSGHVMRDVFGGGRGYDNWNGQGWMSDEEKLTMDISSKGYVFGHTQVYIRGGEIGTKDGVRQGYGNVFGGGDRGFVFSAYEGGRGRKSGARYDNGDEGYYYEHNGSEFVTHNGEKILTEDCKVLVGVQCKAKAPITITNVFYPKDAPVPPQDIDYIRTNCSNLYSSINTYGHVTADGGITVPERTYQTGEYVTTYALNCLKDLSNDPDQWAKVDDSGVIIHNAIFAGGNVSSGDDQVYANAPTVFGNATASIHDVYSRDLISVGTGHTGGLYGDGNLTFVDGYRGLNITNYGTDHYNLLDDITLEAYNALTAREKEYYELKYECVQACTNKDGHAYVPGDKLSHSDLLALFEGKDGQTHTNIFNNDGSINSAYWIQKGVTSLYAGRIMNTIQRADFCGVFGSRMVLQGAPDRVPETVDYTNYTINRVRELSLNKKVSVAGDTDPKKAEHGNYFGIYSIVNFLGNLTSDVNMTDVRVTGNSDYPSNKADETYYEYKQWCYEHPLKKRGRNRASSHNKVALASGVYLELTTEKSAGKGVYEKDWGYITGIVELDLINVQKGIGGGYVYARNVHGVRTPTNYKHTKITALNNGAVTRKDYTYSDDGERYKTATDLLEFETSGNFVHDAQTIIDDCYDIAAKYKGADRSPAHYWYIKGEVYIYDQYISAYTGAPAAYKETVNIPLTITAASHGKLKLLNIKPNHYAYYSHSGAVIGSSETIELNGREYRLNEPIDYWQYNLLAPHEQALFVDETYVTIKDCTLGGKDYPKGTVLLPGNATNPAEGTYNYLKAHAPTKDLDDDSTTPAQPYVTISNGSTTEDVEFDFVFRKTNNISHDTGYILTYDVNNPMEWNDWYTPKTGSSVAGKKNTDKYSELADNEKAAYFVGPTYTIKTPSDAGIYGQHNYVVSDIIDDEAYTSYQAMITAGHHPSGTQATFNDAYVVTIDELNTDDSHGNTQRLFKGSALAKENYTDAQWAAMSSSIAPALVATTTIQVSNSEYIFTGALVTQARKNELIAAATTAGNTELATLLTNSIIPAHYCTAGGLYGGSNYEYGKNYRALEAWSSMSPEDREHFTFNYDALDVLIDPTYSRAAGEKYQYDSSAATPAAARANHAEYSLERPVDYTATFEAETAITVPNDVTVKRGNTSLTTKTIQKNDVLTRVEYEKLPNEQYHYSPISVAEEGNIYVVHTAFIEGETPYAVGQTLSTDEYSSLHQNSKNNITTLYYTSADVGKTYYYCREEYTIGENGEGHSVTDVSTSTHRTYSTGKVPVGVIIAQGDVNAEGTYMHLVNKQKNFLIQGVAPVETSTLYVARNSDIYNLSEDKIITVIYQYDYEDSDDSGMHITPVSERHVVNIHLQFKSGIPSVETITAPDLVLPGTNVVIRTPNVTPGAYEVLGGGWEIYRNSQDAENHANGMEYLPTVNPIYWYQNDYYVAYYAKTYLGKTYSNSVPLSVANYHDLKKVMDDKAHHYYVDHTDVKRDPKIYINDYATNDPATTANGLTILKDFFDLTTYQRTYTITNGVQTANVISSTSTDPLYNHVGVETSQIGGCKNLEFILRTDLAAPADANTPSGYATWTSIGNDNSTKCFDGILHGDGHVISGLDNSLFAHLCGDVYNLGVTGSFTSAGLADEGTGFVENCWVKSSATAATGVKAVFNEPTNTGGTNPRTVHVVNCYYPDTNGFTAQKGTTAKSESAFYNGEVTYDLNEFYLFKRYCDNNASTITGNDYSYWKDVNGTLTKQTGHYTSVEGPYLVNANNAYVGSYVESRFIDGDFIYAGGSIPGSANMRYDDTDKKHYPIWPDDYLYFGQKLNFGHVASPAHQPLPAPVNKNAERLPTAASGVHSNRVYRAPAYYRSLTMGMAHFNPDAVFAQTKNGDATLIAHKDMTAIDFTGTNGDLSSGYQKGLQTAVPAATSTPGGLPERFYPPLLDDDGLFSIQNINLTRNLLVYTGATGGTGTGETPTASQQTANTVSAYLLDWAYSESDADYRTVNVYDTYSERVLGHWVEGSGGSYTAPRDHLLVDKNDFNAPVSYTFANNKRMWYQRTPDTFVDRKKGWEGVSIPFSAEIVTTQTKGELTHFYETTVTDSKGVNVGGTGHEYWLRQFTHGGTTSGNVYTAAFKYPDAGSNTKRYTNDFLWDYYYQYSSANRQDKNTDEYQQEYYQADNQGIVKTYSDYPYSVAGKPYIIGFPGTTYYEFDLSGNFIPENTRNDEIPARLPKQTVTFASPTGTTIAVSDKETLPDNSATFCGSTEDGYTFRPSYLNESFAAGTNTFTLKANYDSDNNGTDDCSSFVKVPATGDATSVYAFRPYFTTADAAPSRRSPEVTEIAFGNTTGIGEDLTPWGGGLTGGLAIYARRGKIIVESHSNDEVPVRILTTSGVNVNTFIIKPGETIETPIHATGIYIANGKKLRVEAR